jgi:SAM-dependent methyltransferase
VSEVSATETTGDRTARPYQANVDLVEQLFSIHGDSHLGLGYPKEQGFLDRYRVYFDVVRLSSFVGSSLRMVDIGCGTARLYDHIKQVAPGQVQYVGLDLSDKMIAACQSKHPDALFVQGDPFEETSIWEPLPDFVVLGGIFTWRPSMTEEQMTEYMVRLLKLAFAHAKVGIAFNVMSKHVDWERDDLYHVPFDTMATLLQTHLTRNYVFRADYRLYEYTTYVYH